MQSWVFSPQGIGQFSDMGRLIALPNLPGSSRVRLDEGDGRQLVFGVARLVK